MTEPSVSQLPLRRLWQERETALQSCIPDEQKKPLISRRRRGCCSVLNATVPARLAWAAGRFGRQRYHPLKPTVLCVRTRKDGTAAGGHHKLVGIVHGAAESVYRVEGLDANDLEDVREVRIEAQAVGPGHQAIQTRYRFTPDDTHDSGKAD